MHKKGIVLAGGGSKGAYAIGVASYKIIEEKKDWDVYVGTSTGNLIAPLLALNKLDVLKQVYTTATNDNIYSHNPFKKDNSINIINVIWRLITGKKSIGEAGKLKELISNSYTVDDHILLKKLEKKVFSAVTNASYNRTEFKYQAESIYSDYKDWMLASASIPVIFPPFFKNDCEYIDGGVVDQVAIQKAVDEGCDEIDVIVLSTEYSTEKKWKSKGLISVLLRTFGILLDQVTTNDILIGQLSGKLKNVTLNFYFTPYKLTDNSAVFDPKKSLEWYNLGYNYAKSNSSKTIHLSYLDDVPEKLNNSQKYYKTWI